MNETDSGMGNTTDPGMGNDMVTLDNGMQNNTTGTDMRNNTDIGMGNNTDIGMGNNTDIGMGNNTNMTGLDMDSGNMVRSLYNCKHCWH